MRVPKSHNLLCMIFFVKTSNYFYVFGYISLPTIYCVLVIITSMIIDGDYTCASNMYNKIKGHAVSNIQIYIFIYMNGFPIKKQKRRKKIERVCYDDSFMIITHFCCFCYKRFVIEDFPYQNTCIDIMLMLCIINLILAYDPEYLQMCIQSQ